MFPNMSSEIRHCASTTVFVEILSACPGPGPPNTQQGEAGSEPERTEVCPGC